MVSKPSYTELEKKIEMLQAEVDTLSEKQKEIQWSDHILNTFFSNLSAYVFFKDLDSRIVKSNQVYQELHFLLTNSQDILGKHSFEIFSKEIAIQFHQDDQQVLKNRKPIINKAKNVVSHQGEEILLLESKYPVEDNHGNIIGLIGFGYDITAQKKKEIALRENEERYRLLMESAPLGIMSFDTSGQIVDLNPKLVELMSSPSAEETKKINMLTYPPLIKQGISGDIKHCLETGESGVYEHSYMSKWNKQVYMRYYLSPILNHDNLVIGGQAIIEDYSKWNEAEKAIRESESKFREMAELLPDVVFEFNQDRNIVFLNHTGMEIFGYTKEDVEKGINFWDLVVNNELNNFVDTLAENSSLELIQFLNELNDIPYSTHMKRKDGSTLLCEVKASVIMGNNETFQGLRGVIRDITRRVEAEQELHQLHEQARKDANTKALLLSEVNHRVKNNLSSIIGMLYTTQRFIKQNNRQTDYITTISDLIHRIEGLAAVHNMLSASMWSPITLKDLTQRTIYSALQSLSPDKKIEVEIVADENLSMSPKRANDLGMIINELTTNTIKHSMQNRSQGRIQVHIFRQEDDILFEYKNDGSIYPENVISQKTHNVGLYLVKTIVSDVLDGTLTLHNDEGASVRIRFNLQE